MREHPIVIELCNCGVRSQRDADVTATRGIGDSAVDAGAAANSNVETEVGNRELAVVGADRISRTMDPVHQVGLGDRSWFRP